MKRVKISYEGLNSEGKKVKGEVEAKDIRHAKRLLRRKGIRAKTLKMPNPLDIDLNLLMVEKGLVKPFGTSDLNRFTKQLSILINAGVPILEALEILAKQERNTALRVSLKSISENVSAGKTLFESMSEQKGFGKLYCSLVKAGEAAGILDIILNKLSEFMEKQEKTKKLIKSAMTYPAIVVVVGIAVVIGLMVYVVPQFVGMLKESNQEIPAVTQFVIDVSNFMQEQFMSIFGGLFISYFAFNAWKSTKRGKLNWDRFVMKAPVFGEIIIKGNLASFTRTLSTMLGSGVSIIESLEICIDTIENDQMSRDLKIVKDSVIKGKSITEPLARIKYFPPLVNQMMKVGESTGNLDQMLIKVADVFEQDTEDAINTMTKLIEPAILVGLGGIIGVVLIAMYLPIFMSAGGA